MSRTTTTLIIGAGQAGLAMSRHLTELGVDHVVIERGSVANSWRTERWDSLRLLTPNWQSRLPGFHYTGPDPDGYLTMPGVVDLLDRFAVSFAAPVHEHTTVLSVRPDVDPSVGYHIQTDQGAWKAKTVVIATGACSTPAIPKMAHNLHPSINQIAPIDYRNPGQLPDGGVLVVGASASGIQLADELARAGRPVTLAVGRHARMPRTYRGMDIQWWLDTLGILDRPYDQVSDINRARRAPSLQLIGTPSRRTIDLNTLAAEGVRLAGRLAWADGATVGFADDLNANASQADSTLNRLLGRCDDHARNAGLDPELGGPGRPLPSTGHPAVERLALADEGVETVIWATGFRPHYPWLHCPVFAADGEISHDGGVVNEAPGMYVMGLPYLRRRKSTFIDGAADDAHDLSRHLAGYLNRMAVAA